MNDCIQPLPTLTDPALARVADAEATLLQEALAGDGRAFAALVRPHLTMLHRVAAREARNAALAEDAVQEALVIVHERLKRYQPNTSFKAWLATIVINRARTLARGERRRALREEAGPTPQPLPSPSAGLSADALTAKVQAALDALPAKRREAAILRLDGGMTHQEIAEAMGSTEGSVRVLVHLALKALRHALDPTTNEGG